MNLIPLLAGTAGAGQASGTGGSPASLIIIMGIMFVAMYFLTIRPQKKKQKEEQEMRDAIAVGDEITTIGGIMGRVVTVKDDSLIIETGADRNKMKITRWAVSTNNSAAERAEEEKKAQQAAAEEAKAKRMAEAAEEGKKSRKKTKKKDDTFED